MTDRHAAMMDTDTRSAVLGQLRGLIHSTQAYFGQHRDAHARALRGHLYERVDALPNTAAAQHLRTAAMLMDQQAGRFHAALLEAMREGIEEEFDAVFPGALSALRPGAAEPESESPISMALLDVDEIERHLLVDRVAQRFNQRYEAPLSALTQLLGALLRAPGFTSADNPFRPATLLRAFAVAWRRCEFDPEAAEDFMSALAPEPLGDWSALYAGLAQILVRAGYSTQQVHRIRRTPSAAASGHAPLGEAEPPATGQSPLGPGAGPAGGGQGTGTGMGMAARARQFLQKLGFLGNAGAVREGAARGGGVPAGEGVGGVSGEEGSPPHGGSPATSAQAPLQTDAALIGFLGGLQQRLGAGSASSQFPSWLDSQDFAGNNVLHRMREREEVRNAPEIDRGTIDALAEVFDYVFADRAIPMQLRLLIGRLQVPVLKAAMLDRDFFLSPQHPARRLVDALAAGAVGWIPERGESDPLYQRIHDTVQRVLREFERDLALFDQLREDFQAWLQQQALEVEATHIAPLARVEDDAEALALARAHADEVVHQRIHACAPGALPAFLLPFLTLQWREVLAHAWVARAARQSMDAAGPDSVGFAATVAGYPGEDPAAGANAPDGPGGPDTWDAAVSTLDDLVWSTLPKATAEERARLVALLPGLVPLMHAELDRLGWQGEARDAFLRRLIDTHMKAIRPPRVAGAQPLPVAGTSSGAGLSPGPGVAAVPAEAPVAADPEATVGQIALQALDKRRAAQQAAATPAGGEDAHDTTARALQRGQWFDLRDAEDRPRRYRLGWVSPQRTRLLFTNREGFEAIVHSEREVAALLRAGRLELLDDLPIVGRAIDRLMAEQATGAAAPDMELQ